MSHPIRAHLPPEIRNRKLVRDRIPEIAARKGDPVAVHPEPTYRHELLLKKLVEEAREVSRTWDDHEMIAELGDLLSVMHALASGRGFAFSAVERAMERKDAERGTFDHALTIACGPTPEERVEDIRSLVQGGIPAVGGGTFMGGYRACLHDVARVGHYPAP